MEKDEINSNLVWQEIEVDNLMEWMKRQIITLREEVDLMEVDEVVD